MHQTSERAIQHYKSPVIQQQQDMNFPMHPKHKKGNLKKYFMKMVVFLKEKMKKKLKKSRKRDTKSGISQ